MSMRIIISPAKKMNQDTDSLAWTDLPAFLDQTSQLLSALRTMSCAELKTLWRCNDQIAELEKDFFFYTWCPYDENNSVIRLVTCWGTTEEDVMAFLKAI